MDKLSECTGFQWDEGNSDKNWIRHRVTRDETEQVFGNRPLVVSQGVSDSERRHFALGESDVSRRLFVVFTVLGTLVRVISARDMSRRERQVYDRAKEQADTSI